MPVLADRVNASDALARIPLESSEEIAAGDLAPALSTPTIAIGAGLASAVFGAFAAGYAVGCGGHKPV